VIILAFASVIIGVYRLALGGLLLSFDWLNLATIALASALATSLILIAISPKRWGRLAGLLSLRSRRPVSTEILHALNLTSARIVDEGYVVLEAGSTVRVFGLSRLRGRPRVPMPEIDTNRRVDGSEYVGVFTKTRDLFSGLQKSGVPCVYAVSFQPVDSSGLRSEISRCRSEALEVSEDLKNSSASKCDLEEKELELRRMLVGERSGFFQTEALFLVWSEGSSGRLDEVKSLLDRRLEIVRASLLAAFPEVSVERLDGASLVDFLKGFFFIQVSSLPSVS
jgi:hypothetical protein